MVLRMSLFSSIASRASCFFSNLGEGPLPLSFTTSSTNTSGASEFVNLFLRSVLSLE